MAEEVLVEITAEGDVIVKTQGFIGPKCRQATAALEAAIGATTKDTLSREYFGATCSLPKNQQVNQGGQ